MNLDSIKSYNWKLKSQNIFEKRRVSDKYKNDRLAAELTRTTHSIEKGLSIESPRLGFGHAKQKEMMNIISTLEQEKNPYYGEVCTMAMDALRAYVVYHDKHEYVDDFIIELKKFIQSHGNNSYDDFGGWLHLIRMI